MCGAAEAFGKIARSRRGVTSAPTIGNRFARGEAPHCREPARRSHETRAAGRSDACRPSPPSRHPAAKRAVFGSWRAWSRNGRPAPRRQTHTETHTHTQQLHWFPIEAGILPRGRSNAAEPDPLRAPLPAAGPALGPEWACGGGGAGWRREQGPGPPGAGAGALLQANRAVILKRRVCVCVCARAHVCACVCVLRVRMRARVAGM